MFRRLTSVFVGSLSRNKTLATGGALALSVAGFGVGFCSAREEGFKEEFRTSYVSLFCCTCMPHTVLSVYKQRNIFQNDVASVVAERRQNEKIMKSDPEKFKAQIAVTLLRRKVAKVLMHRLGYSQEELDVIGDDVDLMMGTGWCLSSCV